jgi:hypothetical protein
MQSVRRRAAAALAVLALAVSAHAQQPTALSAAQMKQQLIGSYKLIVFMSFDEKGTATKNPLSEGQIVYDAAGRMSAQLTRPGRPKFAGNQGTEAERAAAYSGFVSYYGRYEVDPLKRIVTHHVEGALSPAMVGQPLVRHVEFSPDGRTLYLSVKVGDRVTGRLQWEKYQ